MRALAVLPTRDLALQVFKVFALLCPAAGLRAVLVAGKASQARGCLPGRRQCLCMQ